MEAKEVIVAQAIANAELMSERDDIRIAYVELKGKYDALVEAAEDPAESEER